MTEPSTAADSSMSAEHAQVHAIIRELAPVQDVELGPTSRLVDDLGYHSLALLELAFTLEDEFDLDPIDEETARTIVTVQDVADHVDRSISARAESP